MANIRSGWTATSSTLYVPGAHGVDMRFVRVTVDCARSLRDTGAGRLTNIDDTDGLPTGVAIDGNVVAIVVVVVGGSLAGSEVCACSCGCNGLRLSSVNTWHVSGCEYDWNSVLRRSARTAGLPQTTAAAATAALPVDCDVVDAQPHLANRLPHVCPLMGVVGLLEGLSEVHAGADGAARMGMGAAVACGDGDVLEVVLSMSIPNTSNTDLFYVIISVHPRLASTQRLRTAVQTKKPMTERWHCDIRAISNPLREAERASVCVAGCVVAASASIVLDDDAR